MPSSYSENGLELQAAGENLNTWGDTKLNNTLKRVNYLVTGYQAIAITGDYSLTSSQSSTSAADFQAYNSLLKFTGTLSANATITVPSKMMRWSIYNATNKALTISTGAGATVAIDAGDRVLVDCDGSACYTTGYGGLALKDYIAAAVIGATGSLPALTGNAGKFLYTDASSSYWKQVNTTDLGDYLTAIVGKQVALAVAL